MATTLEHRKSGDRAQEEAGEKNYPELERRRQEVIRNFRQVYIPKTYQELGAASLEQTLELERGLDHISLGEEDIAGWETFWTGEAQDMMQSAHKLYHE